MSEENRYSCKNCENENTSKCSKCVVDIDIYGNSSKPSEFYPKCKCKEDAAYEYVQHPSHYGGEDNPYECIKVIEAWGLDKNFDLGTAVRYICRAGSKPDNPVLQDLEKAAWYLNREIEKLKMMDKKEKGEKQND